MREHVLNVEVELRFVRTDRKAADIFTKAPGLDKLKQFSEMIGLQHRDLPYFRGRTTDEENRREGAKEGLGPKDEQRA